LSTPDFEKSPLPPFSKGGRKKDEFKSPFVKGGFIALAKSSFLFSPLPQRGERGRVRGDRKKKLATSIVYRSRIIFNKI
jgi:hypothetical protein